MHGAHAIVTLQDEDVVCVNQEFEKLNLTQEKLDKKLDLRIKESNFLWKHGRFRHTGLICGALHKLTKEQQGEIKALQERVKTLEKIIEKQEEKNVRIYERLDETKPV